MEFAASQIARLVLGYLKAEKCQTAFDAFFSTSPHFEYTSNNRLRSKYIVTRVLGYSLRDFLEQYALIYNLVQERLEPTDYFEEYSSRNIIDQLTYLLDKVHQTRQNTPQGSRSSTPIKEINRNKSIFQQNLSIIQEHVTPELNTTPLEALPGNSDEFNNDVPKRRTGIKTNKNTTIEELDSGDSPENYQEEVEDLEVLKQTLLEHRELHEKIAENINHIISTADNTKLDEEKVSSELDSAIKAIVEKTEADPIFEKLIGDLIGCTQEDGEAQEQYEFEPKQSLQSAEDQKPSTKPMDNNNEAISQRLRNSKKQTSNAIDEITSYVQMETKMSQTEEVHDVNENIQRDHKIKIVEPPNLDLQRNLTVNTNSGDIILYDGTLDNYMKTSTVNTANPILLNNNLLMVQPALVKQTTIAGPLVKGIQVDKPYLVWNNSQLINVSVPQYKVNNMTEQDILNMPTVIVCDDINRQVPSNRAIKPSGLTEPAKLLPREPPKLIPREPPKLVPRDITETSIREYLTLYQSTDDQQPTVSSKPKSTPRSHKNDSAKTTQTIHIEILKPLDMPKEKTTIKGDEKESKQFSEKPSSPRPITPEPNKQTNRKTTPKSGSHVRALDFNFNTPGHSSLTSRKPENSPKSTKKKSPGKISSGKISKSLFGSPSRNSKLEDTDNKIESKKEDKIERKNTVHKQKKMASWDADLRALMGSVKEPAPTKKKKKESGKKSSKKSQLNNTESDAQAIEANLRVIDLEKDYSDGKIKKGNEKQILAKEENRNQEVNAEVESTIDKVENEDDQTSEFTVTLINCNAKSKFRRKCNIDNNISKAVKITKVKQIKSLEIVPDSNNKLILSPSKLNANKRSLVENNDKEINLVLSESVDSMLETTQNNVKMNSNEHPVLPSLAEDVIDSQSNNRKVQNNEKLAEECLDNEKRINSDPVMKDSGKFVTPEMPRAPNIHPVTANRNLTPMLQTPMKFLDSSMKLDDIPKTPGVYIPNSNDNTPMTKLLNEQLQGVDILSIPTPKFPLTPSFPFTPFNTKSPCPNRSTDYSTTSSYYQPSDSEQSKSLEALLEECRRLESKKYTPEKEEKKVETVESVIRPSISEKISSFNKNQIAKKNLNLVQRGLENSSCESSSSDGESCSSSGEDTESSGSLWDNSANETVMPKKTETPYMLRPRKKEEIASVKKIETIQNIVTQKKVKLQLEEQPIMNTKEAILKEVEEKRKRTIAKFKQEKDKPPPKKRSTPAEKTPLPAKKCVIPSRAVAGKFSRNSKAKSGRIKLPTVTEDAKPKPVNKRKSKSPKKLTQKVPTNIIATKDKDVTFHISSDDDHIRPLDVVETELLENSSSSTEHPLTTFQKTLDSLKSTLKAKESHENVSDQEATSLVEALKERGIYLIPNKTPRKQDKSAHTDNAKDDNTSAVINLQEIQANGIAHAAKYDDKLNKSVENKTDTIQKESCEKLQPAEIKFPENKAESSTFEHVSNDPIKLSTTSKLREEQNVKGDYSGENNAKVEHRTEVKHNDKRKETSHSKIDNEKELRKREENDNQSIPLDININKVKLSDVNDVSLEDGEVVSEDEVKKTCLKTDSRRKSYKPSKTSSIGSSRHPRKVENDRSSKSSRKESFNRDKSRRPPTRHGKTESKRSDERSSHSKKDKLDNSKNISDIKPVPQVQKNPLPCASQTISCPSVMLINVEQDLNLTDSLAEEVFDTKFFHDETLKLVYNPNKTPDKTLKDYDLPISNKYFVVEIYGEQIEMSITQFEMILDMPESKPDEKVKILQNEVLNINKSSSPVNVLHKYLVKPPTIMDAISPLDNLYSANTVRYPSTKVQTLKITERRRNSVDQKRVCALKPKRSTRSKSVDYNSISLQRKEGVRPPANAKTPVEEPIKNSSTTENKSPKYDELKLIEDSSPNVKPSPRQIDDDLMNYAICGSERVENDIDEKGRPNKRKAKDDAGDSQLKKMKCEELLNKINVDVFLTQLHGDR